MRKHRRYNFAVTTAVLAAGLAAGRALAGQANWNVADGAWHESSSWAQGNIPGVLDNAAINYNPSPGTSGLARINTDVGTVGRVEVVKGNTVRVLYNGKLAITGQMHLGIGNAGFLELTADNPMILPPPTVNVGEKLAVGGFDGSGRVNQRLGFVNVGGDVLLGHSNVLTNPGPPSGFYDLAGGRLKVNGTVYVGADANGSTAHFDLRTGAVAELHGITSLDTGFVNHLGGEMHLGQGGLVFPTAGGVRFMRYTMHGGTFATARTVVNDAGEFDYRGGFVSAGRLHVNGGRVVLSGPGPKMIHTIELSVTDTPNGKGFIDLDTGGLSVNYSSSPMVQIRELIARGYRGGLWTSDGVYHGITSTAAGQTVNSPHKMALGYIDPIVGPFEGTPDSSDLLGGSTVTVKYTIAGDANLDGLVNLIDFNRLAQNFGELDAFWQHGDFNYDGRVNLQDFNVLAANFGLALPGPEVTAQDWAALAAAVPEPASAFIVGLAALAGGSARSLRRRRDSCVSPPPRSCAV